MNIILVFNTEVMYRLILKQYFYTIHESVIDSVQFV